MNPGAIAQNIQFRLPLHGRIRTGTKSAKGYPTSLKTFRLTSSDRSAIEDVAAQYGGKVQAWNNQNNPEWEVITETNDMPVILPPDPLAGPTWEFWQAGGMQFSCDGTTCEKRVKTPDGPEWVDEPCLCEANNQKVCKPTSRLKVLLPDVSLGGAWMLSTGSLYAAMELPGMVKLVQMVYSATLTPARLVLEARTAKSDGQTKKFNVPMLRTQRTIAELMTDQKMMGLNVADVVETHELSDPEVLEGSIINE